MENWINHDSPLSGSERIIAATWSARCRAAAVRYLGLISATAQEDAVSKAVKLLPEEDPEALCARLWGE